MKGSIKNGIAIGCVTATGLIIFAPVVSLPAAAAISITAAGGAIAVGEAGPKVLEWGKTATEWLGKQITKYKPSATDALDAISPANPGQNVILGGALGAAVGALEATLTGRNPVVDAAIGAATGATSGLVFSDQRLGNGLKRVGTAVAEQGDALKADGGKIKKRA